MHPDRAPPDERAASNEKFKTLKDAYEVLIDSEKRAQYDETGFVMNENLARSTYIVSDAQMAECIKNYCGSELERQDIRNAYMEGRGNITFVMKNVPFLVATDKPRIILIVNGNFFVFILSLTLQFEFAFAICNDTNFHRAELLRSGFVSDFSIIAKNNVSSNASKPKKRAAMAIKGKFDKFISTPFIQLYENCCESFSHIFR